MIELSRATRKRVRTLFPPGEWATVEALLVDQCGDDLPCVEPSYKQLAERIRCAVLKLSGGDLESLRREIREAHVDWRDTLVRAGFGGDLRAHRRWRPWVHR
jgi:hypothetical protein